MLAKKTVEALLEDDMLPALQEERERLTRIDRWWRWDHDRPHSPKNKATAEYEELGDRSQTPWLGLVVTSVAQELYVDGYRSAQASEEAAAWAWWGKNGLDRRQIAIHRAALGYGYAFASVMRGTSTLGEDMPVVRGISPRKSMAFWEDPAEDDWPAHFLAVTEAKIDGEWGWQAKFWDDEVMHRLQVAANGRITYIDHVVHDTGVVPVVRFANLLDLEGRTDGEVEPFIPLAGRIDQTVFDRLVVQRFASWVVRTIAGMAKPDDEAKAAAERLRLAVEDILIADDPETKFGSLPASSLDGFIAAVEADIHALAAVSQTPAHELLGEVANLSAEALAAARMALNRKVEERKHAFGQSWEQVLRLCSRVMGDRAAAADMSAQVRWRDMEGRSLASAADALGKLAQMLGVPVEMLWERIPGWTQTDVERAKAIAERQGGLAALFAELTEPPPV